MNYDKTYIFWDIESNKLPRGYNVYLLKDAITYYLESIGFVGTKYFIGVVGLIEPARLSWDNFQGLMQSGFHVEVVGSGNWLVY